MTYTKTISRGELIRVADEALNQVDLTGLEVDESLRAQVMTTAREVPKVAGDGSWWLDDEHCGCLVGWMLHGAPEQYSIYEELGYAYLHAMRHVLGDERWKHAAYCLDVVPE